ncbi:hypothetical protein SCB29_33190, partial [Paraburkholderia sp. SIMBA_055]
WAWARPPAFDMADWLRQSKRAHHALEKSASGNGQAEPLTLHLQTEIPLSLVLDIAGMEPC